MMDDRRRGVGKQRGKPLIDVLFAGEGEMARRPSVTHAWDHLWKTLDDCGVACVAQGEWTPPEYAERVGEAVGYLQESGRLSVAQIEAVARLVACVVQAVMHQHPFPEE
jgi:hypothetical protein